MATLFALIYLTITVTNFGLDLSIAPFFSQITACKTNFKRYFLRQLLVQIGIYLISAGIAIFILSILIPFKQIVSLDWLLLFIIASLIITEGIKKIARIILQIAFFTSITALVEIFYIISYIICFWSYYTFKQTISLYTIFFPMLILSCSATIFLALTIYRFYCTLPSKAASNNIALSWKQIGKNRVVNYGYQITKLIFTSNFLIPFFAFSFGLSMAALLELVVAFTQFITVIIQKVFGITGQALLSQMKHKDLKEKQHAFALVSNILYPLLYTIIIGAFITYKPLCAYTLPSQVHNSSLTALLFFLLLFCENFIILYEKWFIVEEKTVYLIALNGSLAILFYVIPRMLQTTSISALLTLLIILRLVSYSVLGIISSYKWQLTVPLKHHYVRYVLVIALGLYLLL